MSAALVDRTKRELQLCSFLNWLDESQKPRKGKSNVHAESMNDMEDSLKEHDEEENDFDSKSIHYPDNTQDNRQNNDNNEKRKLF